MRTEGGLQERDQGENNGTDRLSDRFDWMENYIERHFIGLLVTIERLRQKLKINPGNGRTRISFIDWEEKKCNNGSIIQIHSLIQP